MQNGLDSILPALFLLVTVRPFHFLVDLGQSRQVKIQRWKSFRITTQKIRMFPWSLHWRRMDKDRHRWQRFSDSPGRGLRRAAAEKQSQAIVHWCNWLFIIGWSIDSVVLQCVNDNVLHQYTSVTFIEIYWHVTFSRSFWHGSLFNLFDSKIKQRKHRNYRKHLEHTNKRKRHRHDGVTQTWHRGRGHSSRAPLEPEPEFH